ncbi:unnamed protein product [Chrysodeixis includens]|uniref:Uncharacterized protein n=1 Tax=Chrysodeixis includens TaxID=689277 RepID=A0A9P0BSI1_CHRIL|nr:unnamed protein product [Chrysodeixis includens]
MNMFDSLLNSIPKNRSDYVNDLEIPDYKLSPYIWTDPEDSLSVSDSVVSGGVEESEKGSVNTSSSIPLSRAMTDSEIDYDRYKRYRRLNYSDTWDHLRYAMDLFPSDYRDMLNKYTPTTSELAAEIADRPYRYLYYDEDVRKRMKKYFDEECTFFTRDDPGLLELKEAVRKLDLKALDLESCDLEHMRYINYLRYKYPKDWWWRAPSYSRYRRLYYPSYLDSTYYKYKYDYTYPSYLDSTYYKYKYTYPRYWNYYCKYC